MPAPPLGPGHHVVHGMLERQPQAPQEPPKLLYAQRDGSPRLALNAARLRRSWEDSRLFLNASTAMAPARKVVSRASAYMARVIWRYQPVQLRTS